MVEGALVERALSALARFVPPERWSVAEFHGDTVRVYLQSASENVPYVARCQRLTVKSFYNSRNRSQSCAPPSCPSKPRVGKACVRAQRSVSRKRRPRSPAKILQWRRRGARGVLNMFAARFKLLKLRRLRKLAALQEAAHAAVADAMAADLRQQSAERVLRMFIARWRFVQVRRTKARSLAALQVTARSTVRQAMLADLSAEKRQIAHDALQIGRHPNLGLLSRP
eukprot:CAMPEP_0198653360 /NCGR_PEP_ID=MMETSP1467-20131203/6994_1 /TAXON_ID=1462469 /ORGANISM="unid. sp., Strain CCMP2135" /LENGTH=225 /DNA_ID=CAMNT_0044389319 /DNA_START=71 /DNA_END=745 /DNA_ORIENTATION=+